MHKSIFTILILLFFQTVWAQNSPLSTGRWVKISLTEQGVYELSYEKLEEMGFNLSNIDPSAIQLFGLPGGMLPQENNANWPASLIEIPVKPITQSQNQFMPGDRVLFYADRVDQMHFDPELDLFEITKNLYTDEVSYFLTVGNSQNKKIEEGIDLGTGFPIFNWHHKLIHHEQELNNILSSGREWYGERITNNTLRFQHSVEQVSDREAKIKVKAMAQGFSSSNLNFSVNGSAGSLNFNAIPNQQYSTKGNEQELIHRFEADENIALEFTYERNGSTNATAYLNHYTLQIPVENQYLSDFLMVNAASVEHTIAEFSISTNTELNIWNVTDPLNPLEQVFRSVGNEIRFSSFMEGAQRFWVFDPTNTPEPKEFEVVTNQNLLGASTPELIIITNALFIDQAEEMAAYRRANDQMEVLVVTVQEVYNEFSAGRPDLSAIRNFIRTKYQQSQQLNYVLLFGKGSYDYKDRISSNTNFVPTYESRNSLHPLFSFSSDDYFGFLDDDEGEWIESRSGDHDLEVGIGRIPITNLGQAIDFVEKWKSYQSNPETLGEWKTKLTFVADDGDRNIHQRDADILARTVEANHSQFEVNKLYLDAYEQESLPNGEFSPEAEQALLDAVHEGRLLINFTGHGAEFGWMQERILTFKTMEQWNNQLKLPFLVTATCEFGRNDDPNTVSGAEFLITKKNSGAIGLVTTARPVFSSTNFTLNEALYEVMLALENGEHYRLGDIIRYTKNNSLEGSINRNFILLGDPSMRLAYPKRNLQINELNGSALTAQDTIRAFEEITFTGHVEGQPDFNGNLIFELLDKPKQKSTIGTESAPFSYAEKDQVLVRGQSVIKNGRFDIITRIPQNIDYNFDQARLQLYATNENATDDAMGVFEDFILGGTENQASSDLLPPRGRLFLNDTTDQLLNSYPNRVRLLAVLEDENGINISSNGLGQNIELTINDSVKYELNDYFHNFPDQYQKGMLSFMVDQLPNGLNELSLSYWDNRGNRNRTALYFIVGENSALINEINNYPNPLKNETHFTINHQLSGDDLEVQIELLDINGQFITHKRERLNNAPPEFTISWDIARELGKQLEKGVYIYEIQISSLSSGLSESKRKKLIISY